jgi:putative oxidoreductase
VLYEDDAALGERDAMTIGETKLVFPGLAGFYASWRDIAYTLVRVIIGYIVFMHGWAKVTGAGVAGVSALMARQGLEPATLFALAAMFLETVGAICIIIGLFTRFGVRRRIGHRLPDRAAGFSINQDGFEYVLLLGIVMFAIAIRGGGPYSVDRVIGKEL